jgi:hypothetical protein
VRGGTEGPCRSGPFLYSEPLCLRRAPSNHDHYPHRLLVITSTLSEIKSPYSYGSVSPNQITQFLIAILAGLRVPFLCSETHQLGEELVASYLYQVYLYHLLEQNDFSRYLTDNDLYAIAKPSVLPNQNSLSLRSRFSADHNDRMTMIKELSG